MVKATLLSVSDHDRNSARMRYVYPVVSRRAGGVSIGINLNPNRRCNWQCVYCQVPGLQRGHAPLIDIAWLRQELQQLLQAVLYGDFMQQRVPEGQRRLCDIAISGDGEPTSSPQFAAVVEAVIAVSQQMLTSPLPLRLITNGSYIGKTHVQAGLRHMAAHHGETWFKIDAGCSDDMQHINGVRMSPEQVISRLRQAADCCPLWIQSCLFADQRHHTEKRLANWLQLLQRIQREHIPLRGVLIYGLARPSQQPVAKFLSPLPEALMQQTVEHLQSYGFSVRLF